MPAARAIRASRASLAALAFLAAALSGCGGSDGGPRSSALTLAGSTSVQPFAEKLAEEFMTLRPGVNINVQGGGSSAGIKAAQTGAAQIGMSSRHLKKGEEGLLQTTIAFDGIAIIAHSANPLTGLSREDIARIFAGEITRWEQAGAGTGQIHFVTREEGSGTRGAFEEMVMGKRNVSPRALVQDSNGAVREIVANDPKALGYISLGLVDNRVKALSVDGVFPSREAITGKTYSVVRPFIFLAREEPKGTAREYIDFVLGAEGQRLLAAEGLIRVTP
jgi:phosphate transport system substrate-binding protein